MTAYTPRRFDRCLLIDPTMRCDNEDAAKCCQGTPNFKCPCDCHRIEKDSEIERLRASLANARKGILTVDDLLRAHGFEADSSARNLLMCVCPDEQLADETSRSLPRDGTRRAAFNAWWQEMWKDNEPRSSPAFDEQLRSWSLDAWLAGAAHERERIAAMRPEKPSDGRQLTLKDFGYAPGNYSFRCLDCGQDAIGDKRARRCEKCAAQALRENRSGLKASEVSK